MSPAGRQPKRASSRRNSSVSEATAWLRLSATRSSRLISGCAQRSFARDGFQTLAAVEKGVAPAASRP